MKNLPPISTFRFGVDIFARVADLDFSRALPIKNEFQWDQPVWEIFRGIVESR